MIGTYLLELQKVNEAKIFIQKAYDFLKLDILDQLK